MLRHVPLWVNLLFALCVACTLFSLYKIANLRSTKLLLLVATSLTLFLLAVSIAAGNGFFLQLDAMPPRFVFALLPPTLLWMGALLLPRTSGHLERSSLFWLSQIHLVRVGVEVVLWEQAVAGNVPFLMTFEGRNYDILAGLTAPVAMKLAATPERFRVLLMLWNIVCLGLLMNIVVHGILSTPLAFQRFGFEQSNVAVLNFPMILLPAMIVPGVLFAHLTSLMILVKRSYRR